MTIPEQTTKQLAQNSPKKELKDWLKGDAFKAQLRAALPNAMSPERFIRIALTATYRNPKLLQCSQESFFNCLLQLGAMGLEPDGRRAHLIPFKDVCTLIIDFKGIAELLRRNHDVSSIHCDVVGVNDKFEIRFGSRGVLDHVPAIRDRGEIFCAYSWVRLPDGTEEYDVMGREEIEAVRKRSRTPNDGPWVTDWNEMAKKTIFRRHSKTLPLSPKTREALERDDDGDALTEQERFAAARPLNVVEPNFAGLKAAIAKVEPPKPTPRRGRSPKTEPRQSLFDESVGQPPSERAVQQEQPKEEVVPSASGPLAEVAARLEAAGISQEDFLLLLCHVHMLENLEPEEIRLGHFVLANAPEEKLQEALDDWDTCIEALSQRPWEKQ